MKQYIEKLAKAKAKFQLERNPAQLEAGDSPKKVDPYSDLDKAAKEDLRKLYAARMSKDIEGC